MDSACQLPNEIILLIASNLEVNDCVNLFRTAKHFSIVKPVIEKSIAELRTVESSFLGTNLFFWKARFVHTLIVDDVTPYEVRTFHMYMKNLTHLLIKPNPVPDPLSYSFIWELSIRHFRRCFSVKKLTLLNYKQSCFPWLIPSFPEATTLKIVSNQCVNLYSNGNITFPPRSKFKTLYAVWASRFNGESSMPLSTLIVVNQLIRRCVAQNVDHISKIVFSVDIDSTGHNPKIVLDTMHHQEADIISNLAIEYQYQLTVDHMEVRCKTNLPLATITQLLNEVFFDKFPFMTVLDLQIRLYGLDDSMVDDLM